MPDAFFKATGDLSLVFSLNVGELQGDDFSGSYTSSVPGIETDSGDYTVLVLQGDPDFDPSITISKVSPQGQFLDYRDDLTIEWAVFGQARLPPIPRFWQNFTSSQEIRPGVEEGGED